MFHRSAQVTHCGKFVILSIVKDCRDNLLYFTDLEKNGDIHGKLSFTPIVTKFEADYEVSKKKHLDTVNFKLIAT